MAIRLHTNRAIRPHTNSIPVTEPKRRKDSPPSKSRSLSRAARQHGTEDQPERPNRNARPANRLHPPPLSSAHDAREARLAGCDRAAILKAHKPQPTRPHPAQGQLLNPISSISHSSSSAHDAREARMAHGGAFRSRTTGQRKNLKQNTAPSLPITLKHQIVT